MEEKGERYRDGEKVGPRDGGQGWLMLMHQYRRRGSMRRPQSCIKELSISERLMMQLITSARISHSGPLRLMPKE